MGERSPSTAYAYRAGRVCQNISNITPHLNSSNQPNICPAWNINIFPEE